MRHITHLKPFGINHTDWKVATLKSFLAKLKNPAKYWQSLLRTCKYFADIFQPTFIHDFPIIQNVVKSGGKLLHLVAGIVQTRFVFKVVFVFHQKVFAPASIGQFVQKVLISDGKAVKTVESISAHVLFSLLNTLGIDHLTPTHRIAQSQNINPNASSCKKM